LSDTVKGPVRIDSSARFFFDVVTTPFGGHACDTGTGADWLIFRIHGADFAIMRNEEAIRSGVTLKLFRLRQQLEYKDLLTGLSGLTGTLPAA
jgi:hypothetical protein